MKQSNKEKLLSGDSLILNKNTKKIIHPKIKAYLEMKRNQDRYNWRLIWASIKKHHPELYNSKTKKLNDACGICQTKEADYEDEAGFYCSEKHRKELIRKIENDEN